MKRREFIMLVGGAAAWPVATRAQQRRTDATHRGLMGYAEDDPETAARLAAFRQRLERRGWTEGGNVQIEVRFTGSSPDRNQPLAKELVSLQPDVILAHTTVAARALQRETVTIPIIFVNVSDLWVRVLSRAWHGRAEMYRHSALSSGIVGKWLALLKEIAPRVMHVGVVGNPKTTPFDFFLRAAEAVAHSLAITLTANTVETANGIERSIGPFERAG